MTPLGAYYRSPLGAFVRSPLGAFGPLGGEEEADWRDTFRIASAALTVRWWTYKESSIDGTITWVEIADPTVIEFAVFPRNGVQRWLQNLLTPFTTLSSGFESIYEIGSFSDDDYTVTRDWKRFNEASAPQYSVSLNLAPSDPFVVTPSGNGVTVELEDPVPADGQPDPFHPGTPPSGISFGTSFPPAGAAPEGMAGFIVPPAAGGTPFAMGTGVFPDDAALYAAALADYPVLIWAGFPTLSIYGQRSFSLRIEESSSGVVPDASGVAT